MDMTAAVLLYASRLDSQAVGSGNCSRNQLWNMGGNLDRTCSWKCLAASLSTLTVLMYWKAEPISFVCNELL